MPEWFPPGIHHRCCNSDEEKGNLLVEGDQINWLDNNDISAHDFHQAVLDMSG